MLEIITMKIWLVTDIIVVCLLTLSICGCSAILRKSEPGSVICAEVKHIVTHDAYKEVQEGTVRKPLSFPYYSQIYDAIQNGVTADDVRAGRLLILDCALGHKWWERHIALKPTKMEIAEGEHVELEAGNVRTHHVAQKALISQSGTLGKIIRKIPAPHTQDTFDVWGPLIKCCGN